MTGLAQKIVTPVQPLLMTAVLLLLCGIPASASADEAADVELTVAIVVHQGTNVEDLSMDQLRRIFLAEQQFWGDKSRITLLVRAPVTFERAFVLDRIYRMSEQQFRQYWIAKMFRAEIPSGPKIVFSNDMARELVTAIPGSISFMRAADVDNTVQLVKIDGKSPGDTDYPLK